MQISQLRLRLIASALALALAAPAAASVQSELAFHRGVLAYGEDRLDDAQRQFETVLAEDPEDTTALHYLALIAQKRDDLEGSLALYQRALAIDAEDPDLLLDRGIVLLAAGRPVEARADFEAVLALQPDRARAHLLAGIAAYRSASYADAKPALARSAELDPSLRDEARYYAGLCDAFLGDLEGAAIAFSDAADGTPLSPLGQSAQNFRQQLQAPTQPDRRWQASVTAGVEYDSNPLLSPDIGSLGLDDDGRGVIRLRGNYRVIQQENADLTVGYDGYLSLHFHETEVDLQTHNPWVSGGYRAGPVRLGLRYDYAWTFIDRSDPFRHLHRVTPSVSFREGDVGLTYLSYQFHYQDYTQRAPGAANSTFDRDGFRHIPALSQFFFLPEPFTYVRLGVGADLLRTNGREWDYNGADAFVGAGYDFDHDISFSWLYRFSWRDYLNPSAVASPPFSNERVDWRHVLTTDLAWAFHEHWEASVGGAFTWNRSDENVYRYDRYIGGAYVTYLF